MKSYTRADIFEIVRDNLIEIVDTIRPDEVTDSASMAELGANSLDIVEVVSCSMRQLQVRVPREALSGLRDIGGLVDLLHRVHQEKRAAATSTAS